MIPFGWKSWFQLFAASTQWSSQSHVYLVSSDGHIPWQLLCFENRTCTWELTPFRPPVAPNNPHRHLLNQPGGQQATANSGNLDWMRLLLLYRELTGCSRQLNPTAALITSFLVDKLYRVKFWSTFTRALKDSGPKSGQWSSRLEWHTTLSSDMRMICSATNLKEQSGMVWGWSFAATILLQRHLLKPRQSKSSRVPHLHYTCFPCKICI